MIEVEEVTHDIGGFSKNPKVECHDVHRPAAHHEDLRQALFAIDLIDCLECETNGPIAANNPNMVHVSSLKLVADWDKIGGRLRDFKLAAIAQDIPNQCVMFGISPVNPSVWIRDNTNARHWVVLMKGNLKMVTKGGIVPPPKKNENSQDEKKRKSFVRVSPSRKSKSKAVEPAAPKRPEVLEAELVEDDEVEEKEAEVAEGELIDVGEGVVPFTGELPDQDISADLDVATVSKERGLVVPSALQRYLNELRRYPLVNIEEERSLARRAYEQNDFEARNRLVTANLRLVVKIAMEYRRAYAQMLDLIQEGNAGLVQAVNRFNPYRNVKLSTYAAWWIRAYILKFLMDNKSLVRMGTTEAQRKLFFRLRSEAEKMYALTQRFDAQLLAENIGVKEQDVVEMQQRLSKNDLSLDAPVGEDNDTRQVDTLTSNFEDADVKLEREELLKLLNKEVANIEKELNERDAYIFKHRILADDPVTLQDVGDKFGITRERARQLESRVMKKIKERLTTAGIFQ